MRYLAIDAGGKRTGLAVGDDATRIVTPVAVIVTTSEAERLRQIGLAIEEHGPGALVVGLPLNMERDQPAGPGATGASGGAVARREGPAAAKARALAGRLAQHFGLPVHLQDERLSTFAADQEMSQSGLTRGQKKERRDALAAAAILREFLAGKGEPRG